MTGASLNRNVSASQHALTTGQETFDRTLVNNVAGSGATQSLRLTYFTARKTETITQVRVITGTTAAAATPTLVRFGIYSVAANGDIALIASTPNDTTLLAAVTTAYTKALSVSVGLVAGTRYAFGILVVSAVAMPSYPCLFTNLLNTEFGQAPRVCALVGSQTDLPASVVNASITAAALAIYSVVLP
jgi:hypothetical protein